MNGFPSRETVERLRMTYPKGTRVELVSMSDPYAKLKPGDQGTVSFGMPSRRCLNHTQMGSAHANIPIFSKAAYIAPTAVRD